MKCFKCEECGKEHKCLHCSHSDESETPTFCLYNHPDDNFDEDINWQEITKEEFLKEVE